LVTMLLNNLYSLDSFQIISHALNNVF